MKLSPHAARYGASLLESELLHLRADLANNLADQIAAAEISSDVALVSAILNDVRELINRAGAVK